MSKINRIRIVNLNYNNNSIIIDDETFDLGGEATLLNLRNGGGKSVLVQMIISLFVSKKYRDVGERRFSDYFTKIEPTFIMVEWKLDYVKEYFLTGMMVRKSQSIEENDDEELDMINFTGEYKNKCAYDIESLPIIDTNSNRKTLKGYGVCRQLFEKLKKDKDSNFSFYDMSSSIQRRSYFSKLEEYQINRKEWESIIKKVNNKESGLSELFMNAKDEKSLVKKWFLEAIDHKLNSENSRIKAFRNLSKKFIMQYKENENKIERKHIVDMYLDDAMQIQLYIDEYLKAQYKCNMHEGTIAHFIKDIKILNENIKKNMEVLSRKKEEAKSKLANIEHERISYNIYLKEDEKGEYQEKRLLSEERIIILQNCVDLCKKDISLYRCARIYNECEEYNNVLEKNKQKLSVLLTEDKDYEVERNEIGAKIYSYYYNEQKRLNDSCEIEKNNILESNKMIDENNNKLTDLRKKKDDVISKIGSLKTEVLFYDKIERKFIKNYTNDIQSGILGQYKEILQRNILGEYEEGILEKYKVKLLDSEKDCDIKYTKCNEFIQKLEEEKRHIDDEKINLWKKEEINKADIERLKNELDTLNKEKEERLKIMTYCELSKEYVDEKIVIIEKLDKKINELEKIKEEYLYNKKQLDNEYTNLKEGKVLDIPSSYKIYFEENDYSYIYGMEWLRKNKALEEKNKEYIKNNPFIPYSIIMPKKDIDRLKNSNCKLYTNSPIPLVSRESLEGVCKNVKESVDSVVKDYQDISFIVMFNEQILNQNKLGQMLKKLEDKMNNEESKILTKKEEINEYRKKREVIDNQIYSENILLQKNDELEKYIKNQSIIREEKLANERKLNDNLTNHKIKNIEKEKLQFLSKKIVQMKHDLIELTNEYNIYLEKMQEKQRYEKKNKDIDKDENTYRQRIIEQSNKVETCKAKLNDMNLSLNETSKEISTYKMYSSNADCDIAITNKDELVSRYKAITQKISEDIDELKKSIEDLSSKYNKKCIQLKDENVYNLEEKEFQKIGEELITAQIKVLKEKLKEYEIEENTAKEENTRIEKMISILNTQIEYEKKNLFKSLEKEELVSRKNIIYTDFENRKVNLSNELEKIEYEYKQMSSNFYKCENIYDALSDCVDFKIVDNCEVIDVSHIEMDELRDWQGKLRSKLKTYYDNNNACRIKTEKFIEKIARKQEYQDDYFKKSFDNLLGLTSNVISLNNQMAITRDAYKTTLEKLKVDLESVDKERENLEDTFLDYVRDIDENMNLIDRDATVKIREKSIKMLKLDMPKWEDNKDLYITKMHDFIDSLINKGIDTINNNENIEETIGVAISTVKLYDAIIDMSNVSIRLYKIEAEKEVPISWKNVASNSGGEGFLSAFVVLNSLLCYMRRDESDIFSNGMEGKVIIMDNPFAQTNAAHLLKPFMDIAKKSNTQLICLSGLGGESIYNRFDNIYILNLVKSGIKKGREYMTKVHYKGREVSLMEKSQIKVESMELNEFQFDVE